MYVNIYVCVYVLKRESYIKMMIWTFKFSTKFSGLFIHILSNWVQHSNNEFPKCIGIYVDGTIDNIRFWIQICTHTHIHKIKPFKNVEAACIQLIKAWRYPPLESFLWNWTRSTWVTLSLREKLTFRNLNSKSKMTLISSL